MTFWYGSVPLTKDPAIFAFDLQDADKKLFFKKLFCLLGLQFFDMITAPRSSGFYQSFVLKSSVVDPWHFGTDPCLWPMDPDLAIFVLDLQDGNKKLFLKSFSAYYFLKVHLHHFSKYFCLMQDPDPYLWLMNPDPGGPKHTDPDPDPGPQHCLKEIEEIFSQITSMEEPGPKLKAI
jgi:hypothetical protein